MFVLPRQHFDFKDDSRVLGLHFNLQTVKHIFREGLSTLFVILCESKCQNDLLKGHTLEKKINSDIRMAF